MKSKTHSPFQFLKEHMKIFCSQQMVLSQAEMQRHFAQEILRISLFIYNKNVHFAQEISWKMSKNFSLG